jgi:hypothetical protein
MTVVKHWRRALLLACMASSAAAQQPIAPPVLQPFADNKQWMLVRDVKYSVGQSSQTIVVPSGFVTDFASIPTVFAGFGLGANGLYSKAAIVHDYLYWSQGCTREQSDNLLMIAMKESMVGAVTRDLIYDGVRTGGQSAWDGNARERAAGIPRVIPEGSREWGDNVLWEVYRLTLKDQGVTDPVFPSSPGYCTLGDSKDVPGPGDPVPRPNG